MSSTKTEAEVRSFYLEAAVSSINAVAARTGRDVPDEAAQALLERAESMAVRAIASRKAAGVWREALGAIDVDPQALLMEAAEANRPVPPLWRTTLGETSALIGAS